MNISSLPGPETIARRRFPNGIVALASENHTSPAVVVQGYIVAGNVDETAEQAGLSAFTAEMLLRGTIHRTFDKINEIIEEIGASVHVSGGRHRTQFSAKCLAEDFSVVLDVLADALLHPTFPVDQTEKVRGALLTQLHERDNDTRQVANLTFRSLAYPPSHPYSRSVIGYRETVERFARDQLDRFYQKYYAPQDMIITAVGALEQDSALDAMGKAFGDWTHQNDGVHLPLPPLEPIPDIRRQFKPLEGKTQTDLVLGCIGLSRNDPDYLAASLANMVLGGFGMMGRLGNTVRDQQGLAYYVYSRLGAGLGPGPWTAVAGVNAQNVERAIQGILAEIEQMSETLVSSQELEDAKAYMTGSLPLRLETNEGVAQAILDMELHQLGLDYLQRYPSLIRAISAREVRDVVARYLQMDCYALAIAGSPNDVES